MKKISNPFYEDIRRNGITLVLPLAPKQRGRRPRDSRSRLDLVIQPGRPRRGESPRPSKAKSVRLPNTVWDALYLRAKKDRTTINAQIRRAVEMFAAT